MSNEIYQMDVYFRGVLSLKPFIRKLTVNDDERVFFFYNLLERKYQVLNRWLARYEFRI